MVEGGGNGERGVISGDASALTAVSGRRRFFLVTPHASVCRWGRGPLTAHPWAPVPRASRGRALPGGALAVPGGRHASRAQQGSPAVPPRRWPSPTGPARARRAGGRPLQELLVRRVCRGQRTPRPAAHPGHSLPCLTHDWDNRGTPFPTSERFQVAQEGKCRHSQEGER